MKAIVIWYNPNKDTYYWKLVYNLFDKYYVGYTNQYNHKVIIVIDLFKDVIKRVPLRKKVLRKLIFFLHRIEKNI